MAKFSLTSQTLQINGKTLTRIQATQAFGDVVKGQLGGFIERESNLSQTGNCWIYDNAKVYDSAVVSGNAKVKHTATIENNAQIKGDAVVEGDSQVRHNAIVEGKANLKEHCLAQDNTHILGSAKMSGFAIAQEQSTIQGNAKVYGHARVRGDCIIEGEATITDSSQVLDHAIVRDGSYVSGEAVISGYAILDKNGSVSGEAIIHSPKTTDIAAMLINRIFYGKNVNATITATEAKLMPSREVTAIAGEYDFTEQGYKYILIPDNMPDTLEVRKQVTTTPARSTDVGGQEDQDSGADTDNETQTPPEEPQVQQGELVPFIKLENDITIEHEIKNGVYGDRVATTYKVFRSTDIIAEALTLVVK